MKTSKQTFLESIFSSISPSSRHRSLKRKNAKLAPDYQPLEPRQLLAADIGLGIEPQSGLLVERFNGIGGNNLTDLTSHATYPNAPNIVSTSADFASDRNVGSNFGLRMRGYITAPADGDYTFWVASDNQGSLLLSDSEDPVGATEIASVAGWTWRYEYYKYASQQSAPITLAAGETYYIEGLMKEGGGGDSLTVAWSGPGISSGNPVIIDESYLTVLDEANHAPLLVDDAFELLEDSDEVTITPLANDTSVHGSSLTVLEHSYVNNGSIVYNDDGTFSYTPAKNFSGADSFTYTVRNEIGATATATVNLNVEQTSGLLFERYNGIGGSPLSSLTSSDKFPHAPDVVGHVDNFEIPNNNANNYGVRLRGYLTASETGEYTFWIAADDTGELWLSDDASSAHKVKIAETTQWTGFQQWTKYESQRSLTISLVAGQDYYIEALMKERWGGDNLSVAWAGPGVSTGAPVVISGEFLTRYDVSLDVPPVANLVADMISSTEANVTWAIPPGSPKFQYEVAVSLDNGESFEVVAVTSTGATSVFIPGLETAENNIFMVQPIIGDGINANPISVKSSPVAVPEASAPDWYRVTVKSNIQRGDAGYSGEGDITSSDNYFFADSPNGAIRSAVAGGATITNFDNEQRFFDFSNSNAYQVSPASSLRDYDLLPSWFSPEWYIASFGIDFDNAYIVSLEDSFQWSNVDSDYNDFFWVVEVTKLESGSIEIQPKATNDFAGASFHSIDGTDLNHETAGEFEVIAKLDKDAAYPLELVVEYPLQDDSLAVELISIQPGTTGVLSLTLWSGVASPTVHAALVNPFTQSPVQEESATPTVFKLKHGIGSLGGETQITVADIASAASDKLKSTITGELTKLFASERQNTYNEWRAQEDFLTIEQMDASFAAGIEVIADRLTKPIENGLIDASANLLLKDSYTFNVHYFENMTVQANELENAISKIGQAAKTERNKQPLTAGDYFKENLEISIADVGGIIGSQALKPVRDNFSSILQDRNNLDFSQIDFDVISTVEWDKVPLLSLEFKHNLDFSGDDGAKGSGFVKFGISNASIADLKSGADFFQQNSKLSAGLQLKGFKLGDSNLDFDSSYSGDILSGNPDHQIEFKLELTR